MGVKKAETELGSFDCVLAEHGKAPSVGKMTIFKTSLVFKAEMFGLDNTTLSIKRRDLDAVDATSMLTLVMTYKETRQLDLQFTNTKPPYRCLLDGWKLKEQDQEGFAVNEKLVKKEELKVHGQGRWRPSFFFFFYDTRTVHIRLLIVPHFLLPPPFTRT